jgi:phenylalanyl-tRNA synthetase beta chain
LGDEWIACLGEIAPVVQENYELGTRAYVAVLDFNTIAAKRRGAAVYKRLPRFPAVLRDLALVCPRQLPVLALRRAIEKAGGALLEDVRLFDVYSGSQIDPDKKSVAFRLQLRSDKATLTDEEADAVIKRCLKALGALDAVLRGV